MTTNAGTGRGSRAVPDDGDAPTPPGAGVFCGVDLHAHSLAICIVVGTRAVRLRKRCRAEPSAFLRAVEPFRAGLTVGLEATAGWYWLYDLCEAEGMTPRLLDPRRLMRGAGGRKGDAADAERIAQALVHLDPSLEVYAVPAERRGVRDLVRAMCEVSDSRGATVTRIRGVFRSHGVPLAAARRGLVESARGLLDRLPTGTRAVAADHLLALEEIERRLNWLRREVRAAVPRVYPRAIELLAGIPGVADTLAAVIAAEIDDVGRFPGPAQLLAFAGLASHKRASGGRILGATTRKAGNTRLKWAFQLAAGTVFQRLHESEAWARRRHPTQRKKAHSILAAKLARAVYVMLKRGVPFDPVHFLSFTASGDETGTARDSARNLQTPAEGGGPDWCEQAGARTFARCHREAVVPPDPWAGAGSHHAHSGEHQMDP